MSTTIQLYRTPKTRLHTSAALSYPSSTQSLHSNHHIHPATNSSTNNESHPVPLPSNNKKRQSGNRQNTISRPTLSKDSSYHAPSTKEGKQGKPATVSSTSTASRKESSASSTAPEEVDKPETTGQSAVPQSSQLTSSTSPKTSKEGAKKAEAPKTLLQRIKGLWESLKYLFRFYYEGVKQIWRDRGIVADLRKTISERESQGGEGIRWIEKAVIEQHRSDLKKLPLFLAILLILEEVLPLVVIYAPSLLPSTCVLPSQKTKMRSEEERLRGLAVQSLSKDELVREAVRQIAIASEESSKSNHTNEKTKSTMSPIEKPLEGTITRQVAQLFALSARGPNVMVQSRLQKHLLKLQADDELLHQAFKNRASSSQWNEICQSDWLWKACAQRGLRSFEADDKIMEQNLIAYLHLTTLPTKFDDTHRSLLPLALYDGTLQDLIRYQQEAEQENSKGIRRRTQEVVEEVKETEKKKEEGNH